MSRPIECAVATEDQLSSLLQIIIDDTWQTKNAPLSLLEFAERVRQVHEGLSIHGYEFGHRTYYESLRLASFLTACGVDDTDASLDIFLLQKVLPRLHGARRKLEPVLQSLGGFAFAKHTMTAAKEDFDVLAVKDINSAAMPKTFAKLHRMMRALHANQFASFSD
jgi:5-methylcytosine-specific restriction protein B